jgi:hypothetical protein
VNVFVTFTFCFGGGSEKHLFCFSVFATKRFTQMHTHTDICLEIDRDNTRSSERQFSTHIFLLFFFSFVRLVFIHREIENRNNIYNSFRYLNFIIKIHLLQLYTTNRSGKERKMAR